MGYALSVDIGGTNTRVALINENYKIEERISFLTDTEDPWPLLKRICEAAAGFRKEVTGLGLSCPGPLDLLNGRVLTPPNLHGAWHYLNLEEELVQMLKIPVYLENDANLAALAEAKLGAGRNCRIVQFLTVSTGLGAGLVIDGKIFHGAHGFANEVANTILIPDGPHHGDLYPGALEALCSGTGIEQRARSAQLSVQHAGEVNDLALKGNPDAVTIMNEAKQYLANYIAGVIGFADPDVIILGGSVALKTEGFVREIEEKTKEKVFPVLRPYVNIRKAALGDDSGLLGAACLVFENS
ncbi:MAG: ROK family protein [Erysipelotrichaceae bacterium]|nr:ROK family protein [Erysipelotrichaceae bacterium]